MIKKLDHVSIVVKNLDEGLKTFEGLLGVEHSHIQEVPDQGIKAAMIMVGDVEIELIEPVNPESGVGKFLEKRGEGIHHVCFEVDDIDKELQSLASRGIELIDKQSRKGLAGKIGFVHPKSTRGVLVELAQKV